MPVNLTEKWGISWHAQLSVLRLWLWRSETHKIAYTNAHCAVGTFYLEHFLSKFWHREHETRVELPIIATLDKSRVHNSYWERENADAYTIPTHPTFYRIFGELLLKPRCQCMQRGCENTINCLQILINFAHCDGLFSFSSEGIIKVL